MKAVRFHNYGGVEELRCETAPDPQPCADGVLIRVRACGVNHIDIMLRSGRLRLPGQQPLPHTLGLEVAGEVVEVGPQVDQFRPGDRVLASAVTCGRCRYCRLGREVLCEDRRMLGAQLPGGYAEYVSILPRGVLRLPPGLAFELAAASRTAFGTAWHVLIERGRLSAGETVLINSASSGVGSAGVQIARLAGARVIATTSTEEKGEKLRALGVDEVIIYRRQDVVQEVQRLTDGLGVDFVFDLVGGRTFQRSLACLAKGGRIATCGAIESEEARLSIIQLFFRELTVIGSTGSTAREVENVLQLVAQGKLRPVIDQVLPLAEARRAHQLMETGHIFGKIVLTQDTGLAG